MTTILQPGDKIRLTGRGWAENLPHLSDTVQTITATVKVGHTYEYRFTPSDMPPGFSADMDPTDYWGVTPVRDTRLIRDELELFVVQHMEAQKLDLSDGMQPLAYFDTPDAPLNTDQIIRLVQETVRAYVEKESE